MLSTLTNGGSVSVFQYSVGSVFGIFHVCIILTSGRYRPSTVERELLVAKETHELESARLSAKIEE